jgi:hypothetical protein
MKVKVKFLGFNFAQIQRELEIESKKGIRVAELQGIF